MFGDHIILKNIWKTIHSGLIDNWDLNIIYKLIQVIAVGKTYTIGGLRPRPNVLNVRTWTRSCMPFSTARKQIISSNKLNRFKKKLLAITLN